MKILVGMPSPDSWGGPIAAEPPFVEELRRLGHDVRAETYVYGDKAKPTPLLQRIRRVTEAARRLRKVLRSQRFDIVHLNTAFDLKTIFRDAYTIFRIRNAETRIFLKLHGSSAREYRNAAFPIARLIKFIARNADGFGYHTEEEQHAFMDLGFDPSKFYKVKNVISIPDGSRVPRETREPGRPAELLFASRFIPTKGLLETIEACAELRRRGVRFRLTCLGEGEMRREAEAAVGRFGLGRVVTFTGHLPEDEVLSHMTHADIFCFPTRHDEGFPLVLFRAVAVGLPIVTTQIRAAKDHLKEPDNCLFCTTDPSNIADRLQELIEDVPLWCEISIRNIEMGRTLAPEPVTREYVAIYQKVIDSRRAES
jgi:glycosyltransferase involved in cell wall biosynthesis